MKPILQYKVLILDFDGTLYYQFPIRFCMLVLMLAFYTLHPNRWKDILIISQFRKLRESDSLQDEYSTLAKHFNQTTTYIKNLIQYWMFERPLPFIRFFQDKQLIKFIKDSPSIKIIYSDYPVQEKLGALNLKVDHAFCSEDFSTRKPSKKGIEQILKIINLPIKDILYIGDREDKDGLCAQSVGMDYINLPQSPILRRRIYKKWF